MNELEGNACIMSLPGHAIIKSWRADDLGVSNVF